MRRGDSPCGLPRTGGFAWVVLLMALAVTSAGAAVVAQRWSDIASREKERQLLRVGDAYAEALEAYRASSPGRDKRYPASLEQLVLDTRHVGTRRHLRRLYPDPLTGQADWVLLRNARGDIIGLHSRSDQAPWAHQAQRLRATDLPAAERYADWVFAPRLPS